MVFCLGQGPYPGLQFFFDYGKPTAHLAATAVVTAGYAKIAIRRRRACLGMPTDCGRRYTMWRCTNDRERGCRKLMGLITAET